MFFPTKQKDTLPIKTVVGTGSPEWRSYSPQTAPTMVADVAFWEAAAHDPTMWNRQECLWLSDLMQPGFLVRHKDRLDEVLIALLCLAGHGTLCWRCEAKVVDEVKFYRPVCEVDKGVPYVFAFVVDESKWEAQEPRCASPIEVMSSESRLNMSVVGWCKEGRWESLLTAFGKRGFGKWSVTQLQQLAQHLHFRDLLDTSPFQLMHGLLQRLGPDLDEESILAIMLARGGLRDGDLDMGIFQTEEM